MDDQITKEQAPNTATKFFSTQFPSLLDMISCIDLIMFTSFVHFVLFSKTALFLSTPCIHVFSIIQHVQYGMPFASL